MLNRRTLNLKFAALFFGTLVLIFSITACGGGGGGGSESTCISSSINQCNLLRTIGNDGANIPEPANTNQEPANTNQKIVHGSVCEYIDSPVVLISIAPPDDFADTCTGTLIQPNTVLTAAHCLPSSPAGVTVSINGTSVPASRVIRHPGYRIDPDTNLVYNDVGLVVLAGPSHGFTMPLLVSRTPAVDELIAIFGFGLNEESVQGVFRSGVMEITEMLPTHILAEYTGDLSNTCGGDSGGPAVQCYVRDDGERVRGVVGTLSSGIDPKCEPGDVSAFTLLSNPTVLQFILDNAPGTGLI